MNRIPPNPSSIRPLARRPCILAVAVSLLLAPGLFGQAPTTSLQGSAAQTASPSEARPKGPSPSDGLSLNHPSGEKLYTVNFDGGSTSKLRNSLRAKFPSDNFVVSESVENLQLPGFELRNVRLAEIGRTIEFLGEGQLQVEVAENAGNGNLWRIGRKNPVEAAATVKMRSVAAANLFADEKALGGIQEAAAEMEDRRLKATEVSKGAGGRIRGATARPLKSQGIFVIIGDEEGVAGLESLIQAAEQRLAEAIAAKAAAVAANGLKMRAVLAPHVFAREQRWKSLVKELESTREHWMKLNMQLQAEAGSGALGLWAQVDPRTEQKVFVLLGSEAAIAGMESLIKAAEQLAMEEDEMELAMLKADRAKEAEKKARAEEAAREQEKLKAAEKGAKTEKSGQ